MYRGNLIDVESSGDMLDILGESNVPYAFYGDIYNQTQADERYLNIINRPSMIKFIIIGGLNYGKRKKKSTQGTND
jgi:hypothetical protein